MGRNRQVLLVDADAEHREQVRHVLGGLEFAVVGEANFGVEASRLAGQLHPDIVLVHLEEPIAVAIRTLEALQEVAPSTTPLVISRRTDAATAHRAMLAGARGYVVSPPTTETLTHVLREARSRHEAQIQRAGLAMSEPGLEPQAPVAAGSVITVFGPKGGIGKTTISTNLSIAIAKRTSARVVLVDSDVYFGDVAINMGIEPELTLPDYFAEIEAGNSPDPRSYLTLHPAGVYVMPARHSGYMRAQPDPDLMASLLQHLAGSFDFVVVDTPGTFNPFVAAALDESTTALLITSADMASIKDARMSLDALREEGFSAERVRLIVNHATNANSVTERDVANTVNYDIFWSLPHDRAVPQSTQRGEPVVLSNPRARMAEQVEALAAFLTGHGPVVEAPRSSGLFSVFRRR